MGYGLDECGTKRGWTELVAMPKVAGVPPTADDVIFNDTEEGKKHLQDIREGILAQL